MMESLTAVMETLRKRGYTEDFNKSPGKDELLGNPDNFMIDNIYRFEGMTNPDDQAILYALSSKKQKGLLVNGYGIYADEAISKITEKLKIKKVRDASSKSKA